MQFKDISNFYISFKISFNIFRQSSEEEKTFLGLHQDDDGALSVQEDLMQFQHVKLSNINTESNFLLIQNILWNSISVLVEEEEGYKLFSVSPWLQ